MRLNILIAGRAGQGINEISNILSKALASAGYFVFNYREYMSLITGGHNFNVLSFSDKQINSHENDYDIVIALNEDALKKHKLKKEAIILASENYKIGNLEIVEIENKKIENVYYAAALFKILGFDKKLLLDYVNKVFAGKNYLKEDLEAVEKAYSKKYKSNLNLKQLKNKNNIFTGAEAVGIGAIESGLQVYLAYPMTPATSLLGFLAEHQKYGLLVHQPESEIAVINAALGSSYSGAISMTGTSGGGFDLMTEALSMAGMAELPLVVYLAQRPGPSTGVPTFSGQGDIDVAVYGGHGDFPRVVVCPGDVQDSYKLTKEAFYLAEKYRTPTIILSDKHLAESSYTVQGIRSYNLKEIKLKYFPGKDLVKTSSYEHDEKGNNIENPKLVKERFEARMKKWKEMKKEVAKLETYQVFGNKNAKKVLVSTGSPKGAITDSLNSLKEFKFIQVNYLEPFADIKDEILGKEVYVLEENSMGMFANLIQRNLGILIPDKNRILKYDALPFTSSEIISRLGGGR